MYVTLHKRVIRELPFLPDRKSLTQLFQPNYINHHQCEEKSADLSVCFDDLVKNVDNLTEYQIVLLLRPTTKNNTPVVANKHGRLPPAPDRVE